MAVLALAPAQRQVLERGPQHVYLFVNTRGDDGSPGAPVGYPMTGVFEREAVWFTTYRAAAKVRHLLRDDRVCCLYASTAVDELPARVLAIRGRAHPSDDTSAFSAPRDDAPLKVPADVRASVADRLSTGKRIVFRIDIEAAEFLVVSPTRTELRWRVPSSC